MMESDNQTRGRVVGSNALLGERLWQHDETGRMCWHADPGPRWSAVPTMHEDELPDDMTDAEYARWFEDSHVPDGVGCRMGPVFSQPNAGLQPQTREAGLSDWKPLLGGALEDAMNAQDFAALARQVTKDLSGKTLDHATFAECGMGYSLTLHFTDGTSSTITPEHDEGFRFTTPNAD